MSRAAIVPGTVLAAAMQSSFLKENTGRIERVADMMADEENKNAYLALIKYRQTGLKKDFPSKHYSTKKYFVKQLRLGQDEVFVDCGAFTGNTLSHFIKNRKGKYKAAIAFEPDPYSFQKLVKNHGGNPKITLINAGAYDRGGEIQFDALGSIGSKITDESNPAGKSRSIQVKSIDSLDMCGEITFIKMDVEGAELNALKGAKETILRNKPKLAISLYHSNEDMVRLAEYIHELVPEYKFYIGQHMLFPSCGETVLYAVMP
jgi:FkbM family methyltransferase